MSDSQTAVRLGTVEAGRPDIRIRRYPDSIVKIKVAGDDGKPPADVKLVAHYVREPDMRAAGVDFDRPQPQPFVSGGEFRHIILPDEEVEISATAAGGWARSARVKLAEGETREVTLRLTKGR